MHPSHNPNPSHKPTSTCVTEYHPPVWLGLPRWMQARHNRQDTRGRHEEDTRRARAKRQEAREGPLWPDTYVCTNKTRSVGGARHETMRTRQVDTQRREEERKQKQRQESIYIHERAPPRRARSSIARFSNRPAFRAGRIPSTPQPAIAPTASFFLFVILYL